jgi:hypothetical protein
VPAPPPATGSLFARRCAVALVACALALLLSLPATAGAARKPNPFIGVWDNQANVYQCGLGDPVKWDAQFARMARSGVGLIRRVFDTHCPATVNDAFMTTAARHHLRVLPVLVDFSRWITTPGPDYGIHPPANLDAYVLQVAGLVQRYGPHGAFWHGPLRKYRRFGARARPSATSTARLRSSRPACRTRGSPSPSPTRPTCASCSSSAPAGTSTPSACRPTRRRPRA